MIRHLTQVWSGIGHALQVGRLSGRRDMEEERRRQTGTWDESFS